MKSANCHRLLLTDVTFRKSPSWNLNPVLCDNVTIRVSGKDSKGMVLRSTDLKAAARDFEFERGASLDAIQKK